MSMTPGQISGTLTAARENSLANIVAGLAQIRAQVDGLSNQVAVCHANLTNTNHKNDTEQILSLVARLKTQIEAAQGVAMAINPKLRDVAQRVRGA
jgi:hypothetical protein